MVHACFLGNNSKMKKTENKDVISAFMLAGGWGAMLLSVVFYLFFWRVDNEPGAKALPGLLITAVSFFTVGGLAVVVSHVRLIIRRAWLMLGVGWVLSIVLLVGAVALAPILLLFMV